jgi:transposase
MRKHLVQLTDEQRVELQALLAGALTRRQRNRVEILLRSDAGDVDTEIAEDLAVATNTVANVRRRFAAEGLGAALTEKPRCGGPAILDGKAEALVVALACSEAPEGRTHWTARMLANRLVELQIVESVSEDTICRVLKKRSQAVAEGIPVPAQGDRRRVHSSDGGRAGVARPALRSATAGGEL